MFLLSQVIFLIKLLHDLVFPMNESRAGAACIVSKFNLTVQMFICSMNEGNSIS